MQKKKEEVRKIYEPIYLRVCKAAKAVGIPVEKGHSDDNDLD
jgi:hypothetical protein